jgi:hypothetical protein
MIALFGDGQLGKAKAGLSKHVIMNAAASGEPGGHFHPNHWKADCASPTGEVVSWQSHKRESKKERDKMKKTLFSIALALVAPFAWAQTSSTTTTTTTTEGGGTITEYTPGSVITLQETSGPRHYRFGKTVTYVTKSGKTLDEETVKTRIKLGIPVHVHYSGEGDNMLVDRVILDED